MHVKHAPWVQDNTPFGPVVFTEALGIPPCFSAITASIKTKNIPNWSSFYVQCNCWLRFSKNLQEKKHNTAEKSNVQMRGIPMTSSQWQPSFCLSVSVGFPEFSRWYWVYLLKWYINLESSLHACFNGIHGFEIDQVFAEKIEVELSVDLGREFKSPRDHQIYFWEVLFTCCGWVHVIV